MPQLEQKLQPRLVQKLIITPQLQQAIKLLQLSKLDLQEEISQELVSNPALEELGNPTETVSASPTQSEDRLPSNDEPTGDDFDYASFFRDLEDSYQPTRGGQESRSEELPTADQLLRTQTGLTEHLTWQLEMSTLAPKEREIGEAIIGNIDEKGYLEATNEEIAAMAPGGTPWPLELVEKVRVEVQHFDPVGVASRTLQECLLFQLGVAGLGDSKAAHAIRDHLPLLESQRFADLAKALGVDAEEMTQIREIMRHLDPHPGEKYNPSPTTYIAPDVYVIKDGDDYRVLLNEEGLPRLRISPTYRRFFDQPGNQGGGSDPSAREFVREKVRAAFRLIRSLEERQRTIFKVATSIVKYQRAFLDQGIEQIRPLVLRDVAEDIGMHESTVSRVVNNKYMHTPRGLFEMRFFFHSGLANAGGDAVSSLTVKEKIKKMVGDEDTRRPLSDQAIAEALRRDGLTIARRTVAKYREELRIAPSTARKR